MDIALQTLNLSLARAHRAEQAQAYRLALAQLGHAHRHTFALRQQLEQAEALVRALEPADQQVAA